MSHIKSPTQTKKKSFNNRNNLLPYYPQRIRTPRTNSIIFFYRFTSYSNDPHTENTTKEQKDFHLENQITKSTTKKKNNTKNLDQNTSQKERKIEK